METLFDSINIDLLYVFVTVSELKSINKSSDVLLLSQPAISKKIKQLEEYFGQKLLIRSSKGVSLTSEGEIFYQKAKKIIREFDSLHYLKNEQDYNSFNSLRIGSLDSISSFKYPNFFINALSTVKEVVLTNKISDLIEPFNNGNLDVILMDSQFKNALTCDFDEEVLYEEPYYIVYSKNNQNLFNLKKEKISAKDLQKYQLLLYPKYCPIHNRIVQIYKELKLKLPSIYEINYSESIISFIKNSDYVTVLPKSLAVNKIKDDENILKTRELDIAFQRQVSVFSNKKVPLKQIVNKLDS